LAGIGFYGKIGDWFVFCLGFGWVLMGLVVECMFDLKYLASFLGVTHLQGF
jgi:hypothetical protein